MFLSNPQDSRIPKSPSCQFLLLPSVPSLSGASLRVLSKQGDLKNLYAMHHAPELAVWNNSYTATGDWDAALARANAKAAAKKPAPKRRAAENRSGN